MEVTECHERLWNGIEDRLQTTSRGWLRPAFVVRVAHTYWKLPRAHRAIKEYVVMVLGFPGQLDAYLALILTKRRRKPLILDVFMSLCLIASERSLTARYPITGRLIYWLESLACLLPDLLIKDTAMV